MANSTKIGKKYLQLSKKRWLSVSSKHSHNVHVHNYSIFAYSIPCTYCTVAEKDKYITHAAMTGK